MLKQIPMTSFNIHETCVEIPFVEVSKTRNDFLERSLFFTTFCGFRKVRFQYYSRQFNSNQLRLSCAKRFQMTYFNIDRWNLGLDILRSSFYEAWRLIYYERCVSYIFCGFRKVCFQCYSRQYKPNKVVLALKRSQTTYFVIVQILV